MSATSQFRSDNSSCCVPLEGLERLMPVRDLTQAIELGEQRELYLWTPVLRERCIQMARRLSRTHAGNLLLTGRKGVGKTALIWQFAELAASGKRG
ncbi:hypothetical protein SH668x_001795 [Planctomicrobium sp. SH668]|uniref:hypothetical protein n=1 Tax=Planctomicrobium sp. SH668 TaxID=3448126 RepID=UPI003F5BB91D